MNIFCDLDGVLVDLQAGYKDVTGMTMEDADRYHNYDHLAFWEEPKKLKDFWSHLPYMPNAEELMAYLDSLQILGHNIYLLSAGVTHWDTCAMQKREWVAKYTPFEVAQCHVVRRSEKRMYARSQDDKPNILIDDFMTNIKEWASAGGYGIHCTDENAKIVIQQIEEIRGAEYHAT